MKKFVVINQALYLQNGLIGLNQKQFEKRKRYLSKTKKKGVYEINSQICLKAGEEILLDESMSKKMRGRVLSSEDYAETLKKESENPGDDDLIQEENHDL